jgi:SAM-dependent methyltransferase
VGESVLGDWHYPPGEACYAGDEEQYQVPKEQFKLVLGRLQRDFGGAPISIIDVGCAAGAFLYHASRSIRVRRAVGLDIDQACLSQAPRWVPEAEFLFDSLADPAYVASQEFDACTCLGVLSAFDDLLVPLRTLLGYVRPGGRLYFIDFINEFPLDVVMRYRRVSADSAGPWAGGLNIRSALTYERLIRELAPGASLSWTRFEMPFPIPRREDPLRAWTISTEESPHQTVVGTGTLLNPYLGTVVLPL